MDGFITLPNHVNFLAKKIERVDCITSDFHAAVVALINWFKDKF